MMWCGVLEHVLTFARVCDEVELGFEDVSDFVLDGVTVFYDSI